MGPEPIPGCLAPGSHLWGWMSEAELYWLRDTAAMMRSVVEVGSLHGRSSFALLTGCSGTVYCIDPWDDPEGFCWPSFMNACGHFPNLKPVRGHSPQVASQVPDVEMVFLDGDHARESVEADIEAWLPKTQVLLCGHDYSHEGFPAVKAVVDAYFGDSVRPAVQDDSDYLVTSIWTVWL